MELNISPSSPVDFTPAANPLFLRITSSILIYSCVFKSYYYCTRSSPGACLWLAAGMFSMAPNFFCLHGYSELLGRSAQPIGQLRGLLLVRFCPWPKKQPPSLAVSTRLLSGGVQNNNRAVFGLSVVPRTCQHSWVILQPLGAHLLVNLCDKLQSCASPSSLSSHLLTVTQPV